MPGAGEVPHFRRVRQVRRLPVQRPSTQLAERTVRVTWIPLPTSAEQLEPPDRDGYYFVCLPPNRWETGSGATFWAT
jgi:hypothetical protein